nr:helix-turn-helix domain-containing protein [Shigella flexneri]
MSGSAFAVTHHAFSSGAGRTSDGNGSHASTLKSPSYTKSVSWQHYLRSVLILQKKQLEMTNYSVTDIAFEAGYSSPSLFIKTFKKLTSFTPKRYRKKLTEFNQ